MYNDPTTGETWRFDVRPDGTIQRGRKYRLPEDYTMDNWTGYWDGDQMVAVYDSRDYHSPTEGDDTERVEYAMRMCREFDQDIDEMLARLAPRIMLDWGHPTPWESRFIAVGVERGVTLYALSWGGDPEGEWRDEVDAVYHGDVWRIEVECWDGDTWQPDEEVYAEWYGEDSAQRGFEAEFPLADVPDAVLVTSEN